jgi:hypothetical protein
VSGKVTGYDAPGGLADVTITLSGYANYSTTTNETGDYSISDVYDRFIHTLTAKLSGYATVTESVEVNGSNEVVNVTMNENLANELVHSGKIPGGKYAVVKITHSSEAVQEFWECGIKTL